MLLVLKMDKSFSVIFFHYILLGWLIILSYLFFFSLCFGDKNSSGARLQIDDVPSTSKQRKCFWNQMKAFFEWLPHPFRAPFSSAALAEIKSQTPHSLFKSIRFDWRWRKWAIWNIHELGTTQVWPLSERLYNFLGCMLHNRYSQAPGAPIKPNLVSPELPTHTLLQPHSSLSQAPRKTLPCLWGVLWASTRASITLLKVDSNSCFVFTVWRSFYLPLEQCPD